ncbi:MAG: cytochrome c3 family protein [Acidobacteriota bacterium]
MDMADYRLITGITMASVSLATVLIAGTTERTPAGTTERTPASRPGSGNLGPLPQAEAAFTSHAPYETGDCGLCHKQSDPRASGALARPVAELCLGCHEDFKQVLSRRFAHAAAEDSCVNCHNPHNSKQPKLLLADPKGLCLGCHDSIKDLALRSKVVHGALSTGGKCAGCHDPHGSEIEHLLLRLPFDLCVKCHAQDGLLDTQGKALTNMRKLLDENSVWHGPVSNKDCTSCHDPHAGSLFRMLAAEYPPEFYAPYDPKLYALCFTCHNEQMLATPETTTLTQFRDGAQNLHYLHVRRSERGRTCRACHEVHASKQPHQIRDGVPYGSGGWILKTNYRETPEGGVCEKTCHATKTYVNTAPSPGTRPSTE